MVRASTKKKQPKSTEVDVLKAENAALKAELVRVTEKKQKVTRQRSFWRAAFAGISATVAIVAFMLFNISYWAQQTIVDNNKFVAAVSPIIKDSDVQKTLQAEISKQIFSRVDVQSELEKILPENLQFIAAPLASQFESFATAKIGDALQSTQVQQAWTTALSTIHTQLIAYIQNPQNDGKITIDEIYKTVGNQLNDSQIGFLFGKNLPNSIGSITVKEVTWLPKARQALDMLDKLTKELAIATVAFTLLAIGLSRRRMSMIVGLISFSLLFMFATLAAIKIGALQVGNMVHSDYAAATTAVYNIVSSSLIAQTQGFIAMLISFLVVGLVTSNIDWLIWLRQKMRQAFDWLFAKLKLSLTVPSWVGWIAHNKAVIGWTLTAVMYVLFALRLPPTVNGVVSAVVASGITVLCLEVLASFVRTCVKNK